MSGKQKSRLYKLTAGAMMAALSIILERVFSLMPASNMLDFRISLSNVPIILAGIIVSPISGALCGVVSDIVGCFISGYAPFPILTVAPLIMGFLPGFILGKMRNNPCYSFFKVLCVIVISHFFASVLVTTYGLCIMRGVGFIPMLITRLWSCLANIVIDTSIVYLLLKTNLAKKI